MSNSEISAWVDHHHLACQVGEWDIDDIVRFVKDIDGYRAETELTEPLRDYFVEVMKEEEASEVAPEVKWPMTIGDPARAIHETFEYGDCGAQNPYNCLIVSHRNIEATIEQYKIWLKHRGVDIDGQLQGLGNS